MGKQRGRPKTEAAKDTIFARIDPDTVKALDEIAKAMRPTATRSALINLACKEFVERQGKQDRKPS